MENNTTKCSSKEHVEINAINFCKECKLNMCNKCDNLHSKLFQNHHIFKLDNNNINEIFTGFCKEKGHNDKLEFFCKNHNELCCASCICRFKYKGKGQHKDCDVSIIDDIKEEKKNKLNENIKLLEELSKIFNNSNNELIKVIEKINENKENIKQNIQKIFTKLRNEINQREDELLLEVDKQFEKLYFKEDLIKENEKLPDKIKTYLEKGNIIEKQWNNENNLIPLINDCINIEKNINIIKEINESIKKCNNYNKLDIKFNIDKDNDIDKLIEKIKIFGNISKMEKNILLFNDSLIINNNQLYNNNLIEWLKPKIVEKVNLLYRKSRDGDSFDIFHKLCDNQGENIIIIKCTEGFIFGGFTSLSWDSHSTWKQDNDTFLFSLTNNQKYKKITRNSINCSRGLGPFYPYVGFRIDNMSQGDIQYTGINYFENYYDIIPNEKKNRKFDVEELEVFKISFK